jgi:hypothetical protein
MKKGIVFQKKYKFIDLYYEKKYMKILVFDREIPLLKKYFESENSVEQIIEDVKKEYIIYKYKKTKNKLMVYVY